MKFLVDAQLPVRLARFLQASGYDTLHTDESRSHYRTSIVCSVVVYSNTTSVLEV